MTEYTLTLLDTTGIQDYIFASNRLQENIGASELVYRATSLWAFESLNTVTAGKHNILRHTALDWDFSADAIEKNPDLLAEVVQAAGGNMLLLFRTRDDAKKFVSNLTLRTLKEAPGLTVLAQHLEKFNFMLDSLPEARKVLEARMRKHKLNRSISVPALGLGITAMCASTGLAAVTTLGAEIKDGKERKETENKLGLPGEDEQTLVSSETAAKRLWRKPANDRLRFMLKNAADDFIFPYELEKLGRLKGEESYIAVIHADGNRMGEKVGKIAEENHKPRIYIQKMREFSKKIERISQHALEVVVGLTVQAAKNGDIPYFEDKNGRYLPFRPLVFGGDDVTFICNGSIAVSLAAAYLEAFEQKAQEEGIDKFHACAGVAIVKIHYPFIRAYNLSEELTKSAKSITRTNDCSALDWHFAQSGLSGSLDVIREREYTTADGGQLQMRPIKLDDNWKRVEKVVKEFAGEYWGKKHNKVVGLREALRKDSAGKAVEKYLDDFGLRQLPEVMGPTVSKTGWGLDENKKPVCYYFDAIELLDHYVPLTITEKEPVA